MKVWISENEGETEAIAADIADNHLHYPVILCLHGNLGAGKTAFSRGLIRHLLNNKDEIVPSPTYTLVQIYNDDSIWHFDLYRLPDCHDLYDIGWEEALGAKLCLIEWPERLGNLKPENSLDITIEALENGHRRITLAV
jgi:tRNA threonylcarbamoyladenosine biosynthesis protein TsaE